MNGTNWCLRWREGEKGARKLRFKILGEVTSEHRKSRKGGKIRIPAEVQAAANAVLGIVNTQQSEPYLLTIGDLVENRFFPDVEKVLRQSSVANYR